MLHIVFLNVRRQRFDHDASSVGLARGERAFSDTFDALAAAFETIRDDINYRHWHQTRSLLFTSLASETAFSL